jgi:tRNA(fMet)-specific endonuclease VapC
MRRDERVVVRAGEYLSDHAQLSFSLVTRYEILRGLEGKGSNERRVAFNRFCETCDVLPLTDSIVQHAADLYGRLRRRGELVGDADILIAATAIQLELVLATNNVAHFARFGDLRIDN